MDLQVLQKWHGGNSQLGLLAARRSGPHRAQMGDYRRYSDYLRPPSAAAVALSDAAGASQMEYRRAAAYPDYRRASPPPVALAASSPPSAAPHGLSTQRAAATKRWSGEQAVVAAAASRVPGGACTAVAWSDGWPTLVRPSALALSSW